MSTYRRCSVCKQALGAQHERSCRWNFSHEAHHVPTEVLILSTEEVIVEDQPTNRRIVNKREYTITTMVIDESIVEETDDLGRAFQIFAKQVSERTPNVLVRVRGKHGDTISGMQGSRRD